jgi:hypothetical protein
MTGWHTSALTRRECGHATAPLLGPLTEISQYRIKTATSGPRGPTPTEEMTDMAEPARARPKPTPETQHFWDGTAAGGTPPGCDTANVYFRRARSAPLRLAQVSVFRPAAAGRSTATSSARPAAPASPPYAIAVVELDEGPRMMSNIIDCPQTPEAWAAR